MVHCFRTASPISIEDWSAKITRPQSWPGLSRAHSARFFGHVEVSRMLSRSCEINKGSRIYAYDFRLKRGGGYLSDGSTGDRTASDVTPRGDACRSVRPCNVSLNADREPDDAVGICSDKHIDSRAPSLSHSNPDLLPVPMDLPERGPAF